MRVTCSQEQLAPVLHILSTMTRNETLPLYHSALFSALRLAEDTELGVLHVMGMGLFGMVGGSVQLPAKVEQPGYTLVPLEPLAEYVGVQRPDFLFLSHTDEQEAEAEALVEPGEHVKLDPPTRRMPLYVKSSAMSARGKTSIYHAQFATFEEWRQYPVPPLQEWLATGKRIAVLQATALKAALSRCIPVAREEAPVKEQAAEMYGVLIRCEADTITLCTTQGTMLLAHRITLAHPVPAVWTGLFSGEALAWIGEALSECEGEVSIIGAEVAQTHQPILLISTAQMTWFCRSMQVPFPRSWTSTLHLPHTEELEVRRTDLIRPLAFFTNANIQTCELETKGTALWIRPCADKADAMQGGAWEIPGVRASSDLHLLVHTKRFKQCLLAVHGDVLRLQVGQLERQEGPVRKRIGFVRSTSEQTTVMMSLSRREVVPLSPPPVLSPSDQTGLTEEGMEQGEASPEA
jgi:hypothetical protein